MVHDGLAPPAASSRGKRGLIFRVTVHLDLVEDPADRDGRSDIHDYKWHYGFIDGERVPRDRHDPLPRDHHDKHRRDDDDYGDDGDERRGRRGRKEGS